MRGMHLAFILIATWFGCCLTVGLSLHLGWLWGYNSGLVDGHRETAERITTLMKSNQIPAELFDRQLKALADRKTVQAPDVSTFVVMPGEKTGAPQVIRMQNDPSKFPDNLNVTIKNITDLLPKVADKPEPEKPEKPEKGKASPASKEPEVKPEASKVGAATKSDDGTVALPAPGETKAWIEAHEKGQK